ncbi:MAG: glycosyltransferase [Rickettsiaceae bacterium]
MKILLVTEKYNPDEIQRDGGARLVETLKRSLGEKLSIMQFDGNKHHTKNRWSFKYPINLENRFERRIANAEFIAKQVKFVVSDFTHVIFVHVSMQFQCLLADNIETWTFPMFLTPSYKFSGEMVPPEYTKMEKIALSYTKNILTPSYFEKKQLQEYYHIPENKIHVIPRGVDRNFFKPVSRDFNKNKPLIFCSVGSIKPQKNTLELVDLFSSIKNAYPESQLRIIGPIQNQPYYKQVKDKISSLRLAESIELIGYVSPEKLSDIIADCHIHISTSNCETFGRSIFETLASGIPNIARLENNAAYDFLQNLPYIRFTSNNNEAMRAIDEILSYFSKLSLMASEIGTLYDDKRLEKPIVAKICNSDTLIVSDYDGTIFHKSCESRTADYIEKFKQFTPRVLCSARSTEDLLVEIKRYDFEVDWIISYSGAVTADGKGSILFINPLLEEEVKEIMNIVPEYQKIIVNNQVIQISTSSTINNSIPGLNIETYHGVSFISNWKSSKLRAICKLLDHINWKGYIKALGDGKYDLEYLRYFDGHLVQGEKEISFANQLKRGRE